MQALLPFYVTIGLPHSWRQMNLEFTDGNLQTVADFASAPDSPFHAAVPGVTPAQIIEAMRTLETRRTPLSRRAWWRRIRPRVSGRRARSARRIHVRARRRTRRPCRPIALLVDSSLIARAGADKLVGGIGDTIAKWYESAPVFDQASDLTVFDRLAYHSAHLIHDMLLEESEPAPLKVHLPPRMRQPYGDVEGEQRLHLAFLALHEQLHEHAVRHFLAVHGGGGSGHACQATWPRSWTST